MLDVGLPNLNGLEAAKRIRKEAPDVKLLFATQTIDTEIMAEGLRNGAHGFIWKIDAALELLPAIRAVRRGDKFVGTSSSKAK